MQQPGDDRVLRGRGLGVLDEVAQRRFLVVADGHVQAHRVAAVVEQVRDLVLGDSRLLRQFLVGGLAPELLVQLTLDPGQLVDLLDEVDGQSDRSALIGHAARDRLTDHHVAYVENLKPFA